MPSRGARPDYEDVVETIDRVRAGGGELVRVTSLGRSIERREIPCVTVTDPAAPDEQKQHVLVAAGQHGVKESGRAIALALLEWLVSDDAEAAEVRRRQVVAIVPCVNPDGAQRDSTRNANGDDIAHTYAIDAPAGTPEGRALEHFALGFAPEVFVDLYGRSGGAIRENTWISPMWGFSADRYFATVMADAMTQAAEEAGFPQAEVIPPLPLHLADAGMDRLGAKLAGEVKALSFGLETVEQYYREPEWRATGLVRLRRLLRYGMEDAFGLGRPGYPCMLISGSRVQGLIAHGATAPARRQNRVDMVNCLRRNYVHLRRGEDGLDRCATMAIRAEECEGTTPDRFAMILRIKKPCRVEAVEWRGQALPPGDDHGYQMWEDANSVFVQANMRDTLAGPQRFLTVRYDSPLLNRDWPQ